MTEAFKGQQHFKGTFITEAAAMVEQLQHIKAFIFDWDGVFNNGHKNIDGNSTYSETDSMGTNLMRFNHYLRNKKQPIAAVITGEHNQRAFLWAKREHFHAVYYKIRHKETALLHLCKQHNLQPSEVMFVFDDVLDFSAAKIAGMRCMINHACNPLLIQFAVDNKLVDYVTRQEGGYGGVREVTELVMALSGRFAESIEHRMQYSDLFTTYVNDRNSTTTEYFTFHNNELTQQASI